MLDNAQDMALRSDGCHADESCCAEEDCCLKSVAGSDSGSGYDHDYGCCNVDECLWHEPQSELP